MNEINNSDLTLIYFSNTATTKKLVWVEPFAVYIELVPEAKYKFVTGDRQLVIDFVNDEQINFWINLKLDLQIYKANKRNPEVWDLVEDWNYSS